MNDLPKHEWEKVEQWAKERRQELLEDLCGEADDRKAVLIRGRIQEIDDLLALPKRVQPAPVESPKY